MGRWNIDPSGVHGTVQRTVGAAQGFDTARSAFSDGTQQGAGSTGSPIIAAALTGFASHHRMTLQALADRVGASVTGAVQATQAYIGGDEEMAARAQRYATTVTYTPLSQR